MTPSHHRQSHGVGMGPLPIVVTSLLVPIVIRVFQFRKERARWGEQRRVLRSGEPADATVLDRVFIDVDAKLRAVQAEQEALRAKQLKRQDDLMRG